MLGYAVKTPVHYFDSSSLAAISAQSLPVLSQYKTCPQHHALVLALSSVLQTIAICCPGALIWNSNPCGGSSSNTTSSGTNSSGANADAGASKSAVLGSPLDRLPIAPSAMPLPSPGHAQGSLNSEVGKLTVMSVSVFKKTLSREMQRPLSYMYIVSMLDSRLSRLCKSAGHSH